MRIALLADLHANREAITACLAHAETQRIDRFVVLGDVVGYGADPGFAVETVRALVRSGGTAVLGNHDHAAVRGEIGGMNPNAGKAIDWTRRQLGADHLDFLARLPYAVEDEDRLYVHANAWAPENWGYVHSSLDAGRSLRATRQRLTFCGHVHPPLLFATARGDAVTRFVPRSGVAIPLPGPRRWLAVVGSAGQPRDGDPAAGYAIYDGRRRNLTYHRVPYDVETAAQKIRDAGLPEFFARRLSAGV